MLWLVVAVLAYFLFALVSLGDRYLLLGAPNPKIYTFYVGVLGILSLILVPFVGFFIPSWPQLLLCLAGALCYVLFLYLMYDALERFEVSRVIPAVGALIPLISFFLIWFLPVGGDSLGFKGVIAFSFLVLGSVIINSGFSKALSLKSFKLSFIVALLASLTFVISKEAYLILPFWTAFIWMRIFTFLISFLLIFTKTVRKEIFGKKKSFTLGGSIFFGSIQVLGALAFILQNWAIALAGIAYLPVINAFQGVQYVFIFIIALIISRKFPKIIEEDLSRKVLFQKISAIIIIGVGFIFLALK